MTAAAAHGVTITASSRPTGSPGAGRRGGGAISFEAARGKSAPGDGDRDGRGPQRPGRCRKSGTVPQPGEAERGTAASPAPTVTAGTLEAPGTVGTLEIPVTTGILKTLGTAGTPETNGTTETGAGPRFALPGRLKGLSPSFRSP